MRQQTFESQVDHHAAFVGTPKDVIEQLHEFDKAMGGVDHASLQVNFNDMPYADAERSVRLFGETVIPHFAGGKWGQIGARA
jgi:alkanesulfonate monooxygenase SsuD/methylene tetrahydromethanopterin reductase-like flavin-dependent oxidoreductase (luciferase family)